MNQKLLIAGYFIQNRWLRRLRTRAAVQRLQDRYLRQQFRFLRAHSPYVAGLPPVEKRADLSALLIMDKQSMMANFNELNTAGLDRDQALEIAIASEKSRDFTPTYNGVSVGLSSGTSGHRVLFVISDRERCMWAGAVPAKFLPPHNLTGHRIAFFLRANNNLYETVNSRTIQFRFFDLYQDMTEHIATLRTHQPTVLVAPPSVLGVLADAVTHGELQLQPTKVIAVAEVLTAFDERRFKEVFHQNIIFQAYQCTEGFLGYTCPHGSLHLNEDVAYFEKEFLDDTRFIPIITDFRHRTQPIVRYRLNDVLTLAADQECACSQATTILVKIEGHEDDVFHFPALADNRNIPVFPEMIEGCFLYVPGITDFRVVQHSPALLKVYTTPNTEAIRGAIKAELHNLATKLQYVAPAVEFHPYEPDFSRKLKRVERM